MPANRSATLGCGFGAAIAAPISATRGSEVARLFAAGSTALGWNVGAAAAAAASAAAFWRCRSAAASRWRAAMASRRAALSASRFLSSSSLRLASSRLLRAFDSVPRAPRQAPPARPA